MQAVKLPPSPLDVLAPDRCLCGYGECCVCPDTERALRHVSAGGASLTPRQRGWCVIEISKFEGQPIITVDDSDADVARGVLNAWADYARDKGLL